MTDAQAAEYSRIAASYKDDPRWQELEKLASEPDTDPEESLWAYRRQAEIERSYRRSAEQCRISGCL